MKKIILLFATFFAITCCNAQKKGFFSYTNKWSLDAIGAYVHSNGPDPMRTGAYGASMTIYNVYMDVYGWPAAHEGSVRIAQWEDTKNISWHIGYRVNIYKGLGICPIVGYSSIEEGITDGYDWTCTSYGIHNRFSCDEHRSGVDYGAVLDYSLRVIDFSRTSNSSAFGTVHFSIGATKHSVFFGIGMGIN